MKKIGIILCACLVCFAACKGKKEEKKKPEMGEKTTVFLKGDPYADMPRLVEVTPDSLKYNETANIDSAAYILEIGANGQPTGKTTCKVSYSQGKVYIVENLKDGQRDSVCTSYYPNGQLWSIETYRNGHQIGDEKCYQENGFPLYIGHYDNSGNCCGTWKYYNEKGELTRSVNADSKTVLCGHCTKCKMLRHQHQRSRMR